MVAGFAGGLGLSGSACGALSATIWKRMLDWCRENTTKNPPFFNNKVAKKILKTFIKETDKKILCSDICEKKFKDLKDHTEYIRQGGCKKLINGCNLSIIAFEKKLVSSNLDSPVIASTPSILYEPCPEVVNTIILS